MNRTVLSGLAAAALLAVTGAPPAHAAGVAEYRGTLDIECLGCGGSTGTMSGLHTAVIDGSGVLNAPFSTVTTVIDRPSAACLVGGSVDGTLPAAGSTIGFRWTHVGAVLLATTGGAINGAGTGVFTVTEPVGMPCGGAVTAQFALTVAGG